MPTWEGRHAVADYLNRAAPRWRPAVAVAAAALLALTVGAAAEQPASAASGYTVTATIEVGTGPDGVAVDPASHTAYVTNVNDDSVSVIDEATRTVTASITVGGGPLTVAADPTSHIVYVTNGGNGTVSVIDEATGTVTAIIPVGHGPDGVAMDPTSQLAYVANGGDGTVSVISEATGKVTATIPVGADPDGVAVDPTSHTAYVANGGASTVSVIGVTRPAPVATVTKVTSSRNPSAFGQSVTFTATVTPADGGSMTFNHGAKALCSAVSLAHVSGSTYRAHCATKTLPVGGTAITAAYRGDAGYAASTGKLTQTVAKAPTAMTEHVASGPHSRFALSAKLTASGSPLGSQPVTFSTGKTHLCSARTNKLGAASCAFTGSKNEILRASYPGSASYRPSSATVKAP
jgi:YVTN family beta-propeller protein